MFTVSKVTEIYCMADDLCKEFALQQDNSRAHFSMKNGPL